MGALEGHEHDEVEEQEPQVGGFDIGLVHCSNDQNCMSCCTSMHRASATNDWFTIGKKGKKAKCEDADVCAISSSHNSLGRGRITIDSGAAESVLPRNMLKEVQLRESEGSKTMHFKVANGGRMPNYGEKKVNFQMTANHQPTQCGKI